MLFSYEDRIINKEKKMKKLFLVFSLIAAVLMVMACGSTPKDKGPTTKPNWINDIPPDDVIWGIGVAKQSNTNMSMTTAEARARTAIARQLNTKVQAMFTDYNLDAGNAKNQASTSLQEDVSRQITNLDVSGARPIKKWEAQDGTWWYLVEIKKSDARNSVSSILGNEEAAYAQFKAKQALDMLDVQLKKSERPVQVDN